MSTVQITIHCPLSPLPANKQFTSLKAVLTDVTGTPKAQTLTAAQVLAVAVVNPDNTMDIPFTFTAVASGDYSVAVQAYDQVNNPLGNIATATGNMPANLGASFPQAAGFTFANS